MVDWHVNNGTLSFWELTNPVCAAIKKIYSLKRKNHGDVEWTGPSTPEFLLSTSLTFEERLSKDMLDYDEHEQGRRASGVQHGQRRTTATNCFPSRRATALSDRQRA